MPVLTKPLREPPSPADGTRILVARYRPRGLPLGAESWDRWEKRIAPSPELVALYYGKRRQGNRVVARGLTPLPWKDYTPRFLAEMRAAPAQEALAELAAELSRGETITLLCYCQDASVCHRSLLAELLTGMSKKKGR